MSDSLIAMALSAAMVSFVVSVLVLKGGVLDFPNARSSHKTPTPRGGGLGVLAGVGAGALAASAFPLGASALGGVLMVTALFGLLGFLDDLFVLDERLKLVSFIVFCAAMVSAAGPVTRIGLTYELGFALPLLVGWVGSALFVFVVVNAANFMDGSDGILAAVMIPAGFALCVAGLAAGVMTSVISGVLLAASLSGFVVLNWPPAKLFAGDVGALGAGALYAGGALALVNHGFSGTLWLAPLFVLVFLADVLLTLLRRARHGRFSLSAHREHAYQRLIDAGWSHQAIALVYGGLTALIGLTGLVAAQFMDAAVPLVFAIWVVVLSALHVSVGRVVGR
ncbi:hypothetical protein [Oceanicaulis sp.]|uniref:hypothetical protein n=1 Tax=Oceanicaulis sp. TaxID=1924941 RepID=UPI003BA8E761